MKYHLVNIQESERLKIKKYLALTNQVNTLEILVNKNNLDEVIVWIMDLKNEAWRSHLYQAADRFKVVDTSDLVKRIKILQVEQRLNR